MDALLLIVVLTLNILISIWNCYAVGTAWKDTMSIGGGFNKLVLWSALIQSGVGFSMPVLITLAGIVRVFLTSGVNPTLTPEEDQQIMQGIFSLWYIAIIFPILGSGLAIWAHSLREAYRHRDFASIATAGWNTYAQISNTISAAETLGGAFGNVGELFSGVFSGDGDDDIKWKLLIVVILIVVIALVSGFMVAFGLVRYFARQTQSRIEEYAKHNELNGQKSYS